MELENYKLEQIIEEVERLSTKYNWSKDKIIKVYLLKELKELNAGLYEYLIYKDSY